MTDGIQLPAPRRRIVLIDDIPSEAHSYRRAIELLMTQQVDVTCCSQPNDVMPLIQDQDWDIVILDMTMPYGSFGKTNTDNGRFTGAKIAEAIRCEEAELPIILLSHASFSEVRDACKSTAEKLTNCIFWEKRRLPPKACASALNKYFESGRLDDPTKSMLQRVFGAILLQPSLSGVGIDLKKLPRKHR